MTQAGTQAGTRSGSAAETVSVDSADVLNALDYYDEQGWTDGLPVVPVTESYLAGFLAATDREPGDVGLADAAAGPSVHGARRRDQRGDGRVPAGVLPGRAGGVGRRSPEEGYARKGIWQSTTGTAPLLHRQRAGAGARSGINSRGQRLRLGLPRQRHHRPGDPADRDQRLRAASARAGPGDPGHAGEVHLPASPRTRRRAPGRRLPRRPRLRREDSAVTAMTDPFGHPHRGTAHRPIPSSSAATSPARSRVPAPWSTRPSAAAWCWVPSTRQLFDRAGWSKPTCAASSTRTPRTARARSPRSARTPSPAAPAGGCLPVIRTRSRTGTPSRVSKDRPGAQLPRGAAGRGGRGQQRGCLRGRRDVRTAR